MYKAFISYSHKTDATLGTALQDGLERFTKPWYRRRAMRVFRDATNLSVNPGLWSSIAAALADSEYFLLMASPDAARSPWVQREIDYWVANKPADHLLIILTSGELQWNNAARDFDWNAKTAMPEGVRGRFREEPNYLDFRWARGADHLTLLDDRFQDAIATLASTLHGRSKDDLVGEDLRQHRRRLQHVGAGAALLFTAFVIAGVFGYRAHRSSEETERQVQLTEQGRRAAISRELAASARDASMDKQLSLLLAMQAVDKTLDHGEPVTPEAQQALHWAIQLLGGDDGFARRWPPLNGAVILGPDGTRIAYIGNPAVVQEIRRSNKPGETVTVGSVVKLDGHREEVVDVAFDRDGDRIATASVDGTIRIWTLRGHSLQVLKVGKRPMPLRSVAFSPTGSRLAAGGDDGVLRIWDVPKVLPVVSVPSTGPLQRVVFSPDGRIVATISGQSLTIWNAANGDRLRTLPVHADQINATAFSADSQRIATTSGFEAYVWNLKTGDKEATFTGHLATVAGVAFHPNGVQLATASSDRTTRIWQIASGQPLLTLDAGPDERFSSVFFSEDGAYLASVGSTSLRIFPLDPTQLRQIARRFVKRSMRVEECKRYLHTERCPDSVAAS